MPADRLLDGPVFSSPAAPWRDVLVAGRWVVQRGRHDQAEAVMAERWPPHAAGP